MQSLPPIPPHILERAKALHSKAHTSGGWKGSITQGDGLQCGYVGEAIVQDMLAQEDVTCVRADNPDYDLLAEGVRIEVKTTRQESTEVRPHYNAHVEHRGRRGLGQQDCEVYVFCRVTNDCAHGAIVGWALYWDVYHRGRWTLQKTGSVMGSGKAATADNWVLPISALANASMLPDYIKYWSKK
jgi:hypothetical protein